MKRISKNKRINFRMTTGLAFESLSKAKKTLEIPLKKIERILKKDSRNIDALLMKGNIIDMYTNSFLEVHEIARSCYEKILAIDPKNVRALIDFGDWYSTLEKYGEAIKYYDQAISLLQKGVYYESLQEEMEEVFIAKSNALKDSKRLKAAKSTAKEGLRYCSKSNKLRSWLTKNK